MKIALDLDGVCFDFVGALRADYLEVDPGAQLGPATQWDFFLHDWGWTVEDFNEQINSAIAEGELYAQPGFVYPGVVEGVAELRRRGHQIHVITDRARFGPPGMAAGQTFDWLAREGIEVDTVTFAKDKAAVLQADIAFDDALHHWTAYRAAGTLCILRDQPYNQMAERAIRVSNFEGFLTIVDSLDHGIPLTTMRAISAPEERSAS